MHTYHVVTSTCETRVQGIGYDIDADFLTVYVDKDAVFQCPVRELIYIKRIDEPGVKINFKADEAIKVADRMRRAERDGTLYTTN